MTADFALRPDQRSLVETILRGHAPRPCAILAFGSRARAEAKPHSDLDLAIDAGRPLTLGERASLSDAFEESTLPWRVDVVDLAACSPEFRRIVEAEGVRLLDLN